MGSANFADFATKLVTIATSLEQSEKEGQIHDLQSHIYHLMKFGENQ